MIKRFKLIFPLVTVMAIVGVTEARAVTITLQGAADLGGTGKGTVLGVLSLAENDGGNGNPEVGSTAWNGSSATFTGDTFDEQHFFSRSVAELASVPITDSFGLVFQVSENGPDQALILNSLAVNFFGANGNSLFSGVYNGPITLAGVGQGSSGWLFKVTLSDDERIQFFADPNNHVGLAADIGDAGGASDNFFAITGASPGTTDVAATPEPASLVLLGSGLALATFRLRRKR
jgi:hypothetical protein